MGNTKDLIWSVIIESAKTRFDYSAFEKEFKVFGKKGAKNFAENFLIMALSGFASKEAKDIMTLKLFNEMLLTGYIWEKAEIQKFLTEKEKLLSLEIYVTQLANSLLDDGSQPLSVLNSVHQLLK